MDEVPGEEPVSFHIPLPSPCLLDGIDTATLAALAGELDYFSLPGGAILFEEGDPGANELYLLLSGSLGVVAGKPIERGALISVVRPGETVGEMGLLAGRPRSASVVAARDSTLLRIGKAAFEELTRRHPAAMMRVAGDLIDRLDRLTRHARPLAAPKTLALVPLGEGVPLADLTAALAGALAASGEKVSVLDSAAAHQDQGFFEAVEAAHSLTLYRGDGDGTAWTRLCLRRADRILLVAQGAAKPPDRLSLVPGADALPWRLTELVLLQEGSARLPAPAAPWLAQLGVKLHYHIRRQNAGDIARLARYLTGRAVGLVLSGGGARGYGHLGVIEALREAGIEIDLLGGTSIGSIMAAGVAIGWDDAEFQERIREAFVRSDPVNDFAVPWVALTQGRKVTARLRQHFGESRAEDLWRPFFAVASNLTSGAVAVLRTGPVWRLLRASIAIPGLLPPVIEGGEVLVDGAVMNNLPADIMSGMRRGPVIGIDVTRYGDLRPPPPASEGWLRRLTGGGVEGPGIVSLLLRTATVGGDAQTLQSRAHADLVLEPPLLDIEIRDWKAFDRAVAAGYRHAMARMDDIHRLCRSP